MTDNPQFKAGDTVFLETSHALRRTTIDKFYKNGNFVLKGSAEQYRPNGLATNNWARTCVLPATKKNVERYIRHALEHRLSVATRTLSAIDLKPASAADIAGASSLVTQAIELLNGEGN